MKDFAARHSSLKQELEGVMQEAKEKEKILEKLGAELEQMRQVEPQKEMIADEDVGEGMSAASMEAAMDQNLTPLTELLSRLTRNVEQMSEDNSVVDVAYGREQAVEGRNDHGTADGRAGIGMVGENSYVRSRRLGWDGDRRGQQDLQGQFISGRRDQNQRCQFRVGACLSGPADSAVSCEPDAPTETGGTRI
jgi:hypothetical protein